MEGTTDETEGVRGEVWMKADFKKWKRREGKRHRRVIK